MEWGLPAKVWNGQGISSKKGTLSELRFLLPEFEFQPFGENEELNQVVRKPTGEEKYDIPIGVVSKSYKLIQHSQVFDWLKEGLFKAGVTEQACESELLLSRYDERMLLRTVIHGMDFDPGDGYPLKVMVSCQNSVDKSVAMEVRIIRLRLVCSNGLMLHVANNIRRLHVQQNKRKMDIATEVAQQLDRASEEQSILSNWYKYPINQDAIENWADTTISKKWGANQAARVAAICQIGWDGEVIKTKNTAPSKWQVGFQEQVPGACAPVNNVYHLAQALSWIATRQPTLEDRLMKISQIQGMIEELIS